MSSKTCYQEADRVWHQVFGIGDVLKSTLTPVGEQVVVRFEQAGVKIVFAESEHLAKAGPDLEKLQ
jgi:hypothetical protein